MTLRPGRAARTLRRALCTALLAALPAAAQALCGGGYASEDLANACLTHAFEADPDPATRDLAAALLAPRLVEQGYGPALGLPDAPRTTRAEAGLLPLVFYDPNVNGGSPEGPLRLGPFDFAIPEDQVREGDIVLGAQLRGSARRILGPGRWLDLSAAASAGRAPSVGATLLDASGGVCARTALGRRHSLNGCLSAAWRGREIDDDRSRVASLDLARVVSAAPVPILATGGLRQRRIDGDDDTALTYGVEAILRGDLVVALAGALADAEPGRHTERRRLTLSLAGAAGPLSGRVFVSRADSFGSDVLGVSRRETDTSAGLAAPLPRGLVLDLVHRRRRGSIAYFDETVTEASLRVAGWRF